MKRTLIISQYSLPHIGGIEAIIDEEVRALAASGHAVTLLTSDGKGQGDTPSYPSNVRITRVRSSHALERWFSIPYPIFFPRVIASLWREVGQATVVHAHGSLCSATLPALLIARIRRRPVVLTEHVVFSGRHWLQMSWILERVGMNTVGRLCARLCSRIVTYNSRVQKLMETLSGSKKKTAFVPYRIDETRFRPPHAGEKASARKAMGWQDDRPKVLFAGRLIADKGIFLLLKAMDPSFDLVFCGPGPELVRERLRQAGALCIGPLKQSEMLALYHAADLLVLPSLREGFPLVAREALTSGLPTILADDSGYLEYRGQRGLFFCARDPQAVRAEILKALHSSAGPEPTEPSNPHTRSQWLAQIYGNFLTLSEG